MEYTYELIEALESYFENNLEQFLPILKELSRSVNDPTAKIKFELKIEDVCKKHNLCISCFESLKYEEFLEDRGEYFGFPATETICEAICNKCKE